MNGLHTKTNQATQCHVKNGKMETQKKSSTNSLAEVSQDAKVKRVGELQDIWESALRMPSSKI